jgi:DNA-binding PadR family transcriptional regulator
MPLHHNDPAELVVLSLLAEGEKYGYMLSKEAASKSDGQLRLTPGVLYPLLRDLETQGLITSSWEEVRSDRSEEDAEGRKRKWYRLSAKGRKRLAQRIDAHRAYRAIIDAFIGRPDTRPRREPSP